VNVWDAAHCQVLQYSPQVDEDPLGAMGDLHAVSLIFYNAHQDYKRMAFFWIRARSAEFEGDHREAASAGDAKRLRRHCPSPVPADFESPARAATPGRLADERGEGKAAAVVSAKSSQDFYYGDEEEEEEEEGDADGDVESGAAGRGRGHDEDEDETGGFDERKPLTDDDDDDVSSVEEERAS